MAEQKEVSVFHPISQEAWRAWLEQNHEEQQAVWLIFYTKASAEYSISWSEAVDEALCFGWIDSKKIAINKEKSHQFFSKRKHKSTWSKINKEKIEKLKAAGKMTKAGLESIEIAKQNGSWTILDEVEELIIPKDLEAAFANKPEAKAYFLSLSKSAKKINLSWIVLAKRAETREKRIQEIVEHASKFENRFNIKPKSS